MISILTDRIPGGRASGQPPIDVDPWQIRRGIAVEMEHTRDPRIAYEIALDHLYELPDYYTRLDRMERAAGLGRSATSRAITTGVLTLVGALAALGIAFYARNA